VGGLVGGVLAPPRAGDIKHSHADIAEARARLGYQAAVSFAEGLRRTIDWYKQQ
jgi:nucleoside-diphosphate-sugar epimerase